MCLRLILFVSTSINVVFFTSVSVSVSSRLALMMGYSSFYIISLLGVFVVEWMNLVALYSVKHLTKRDVSVWCRKHRSDIFGWMTTLESRLRSRKRSGEKRMARCMHTLQLNIHLDDGGCCTSYNNGNFMWTVVDTVEERMPCRGHYGDCSWHNCRRLGEGACRYAIFS